MALILSLETSTTICSAALHRDGKLLIAEELLTPQSASSQLSPLIDQLLTTAKVTPKDLAAVAVASGPGSYTGLRIGVATAKGICFGLNVPLIAINTLEVMAAQVAKSFQESTEDILLCPMLDARRMEVYCLVSDPRLNEVEPTQAKVIDAESFANRLAQRTVYFFGNGADKCKNVINHPNARFLNDLHPTAKQLGVMAFHKFEKGEFENLSSFEPHYLKEFMVKKPKTV